MTFSGLVTRTVRPANSTSMCSPRGTANVNSRPGSSPGRQLVAICNASVPFRHLLACGGGGEGGHERVPAVRVRVAPRHTVRTESLPSGVHDLQPGGAVALVDERQLDVGRIAAVATDVPEV